MRNLKIYRPNSVLAFIAFFAFVFTLTLEVAAQSEIQFSELYNCPNSSLYNFKVLECENERYCKVAFMTSTTPQTVSFESEVAKSKITDAFKAGGCTINGKPLESAKDTTKRENKPEGKPQQNTKTNNDKDGRFNIGDRVLASPVMLDEDKYFEKCTVIKDYLKTEGADAYRVRCDSPDGGIGREANVGGKFIRAWANATPPPTAPECTFEEPPGKVTRASKPSAELFKRVFFEWLQSKSNGRQIGLTFQTFQVGTPVANRVTTSGLLYRTAPAGATIYPIKANYIFCDRYDGQTIRRVYEDQFECFKDKFGDWVCGGGTAQPKSQIYLPNE
jgi:hypothetical protein